MDLFINIFHVVLCILLILVIILQPSKGSDIGAAFGGGGGSSTMFGPRGAGSVLSKATTVIAVLFMVTSISLAMRSVPQGGAGTSLSDEGTLEGLEDIDLGLDDLDLGLDFTATEEPAEASEGEELLPVDGEAPAAEGAPEGAAIDAETQSEPEAEETEAPSTPAEEPVDGEDSQ
ncbi:MAG: preprotein translocase subunit SecG [Myxococcota bacterium]|nr:preprotein translocase subunit SecG [Myxococcota bacterium]